MRSIALTVVSLVFAVDLVADSAIPLLSGFDRERVSSCYPLRDTGVAGEAAKLLYRLRKANAKNFQSLAGDLASEFEAAQIGDVFELTGTLEKIRQYEVPTSLSDYLGMESFQELVLAETPLAGVSILVPPLQGKVSRGDRVAATAMLLYRDEQNIVFAAGRAGWFPSLAQNNGIELLMSAGVDATGLATAAARNRRKLETADGDTFYSMLAAAARVANREQLPEPQNLAPIMLLQQSEKHHGNWIRMRATTVRITKVNVIDAERREELGQDHYFQIDSSGDLGKTIVKLKRSDGEPIEISGKYPISLVSLRLPPFLREPFESEQSVVQMTSQPVRFEGFFYRLWSYRNEFIDQRGGGNQVGPLIVVARWHSLEEAAGKDDDIAVLGYVMAAGVILAILATFLWSRQNASVDAQVREKQQGGVDIKLK